MAHGFRILAIVLGIGLMIVVLGACGYSAPEPVDRVVEVSKIVSVEEAVQPARGQSAPEETAASGPTTPQGSPVPGFNTIGGSAPVNDEAYDLTFFRHYGLNPFIDTEDDHLSTFAMDVDTASYTVPVGSCRTATCPIQTRCGLKNS